MIRLRVTRDAPISRRRPRRCAAILARWADAYGLPRNLVQAVARTASGFDANKISAQPQETFGDSAREFDPENKSYGLMQVSDAHIGQTVRDPNGEPFRIGQNVKYDWKANARAGVALLAQQHQLAQLEQPYASPREHAQQASLDYLAGHTLSHSATLPAAAETSTTSANPAERDPLLDYAPSGQRQPQPIPMPQPRTDSAPAETMPYQPMERPQPSYPARPLRFGRKPSLGDIFAMPEFSRQPRQPSLGDILLLQNASQQAQPTALLAAQASSTPPSGSQRKADDAGQTASPAPPAQAQQPVLQRPAQNSPKPLRPVSPPKSAVEQQSGVPQKPASQAPSTPVDMQRSAQAQRGHDTALRQILIDVQNNALQNPAFAPNRAAGTTYCNAATLKVARQMGAPTKGVLTDGKGNLVNANTQARNLGNSSAYREVTPTEAQALANQGELSIVAWENKTGGSGHVATVRPEGVSGDNPPKGSSGPLLSNIGNTIGVLGQNYAFRKDMEVHYYTPR